LKGIPDASHFRILASPLFFHTLSFLHSCLSLIPRFHPLFRTRQSLVSLWFSGPSCLLSASAALRLSGPFTPGMIHPPCSPLLRLFVSYTTGCCSDVRFLCEFSWSGSACFSCNPVRRMADIVCLSPAILAGPSALPRRPPPPSSFQMSLSADFLKI